MHTFSLDSPLDDIVNVALATTSSSAGASAAGCTSTGGVGSASTAAIPAMSSSMRTIAAALRAALALAPSLGRTPRGGEETADNNAWLRCRSACLVALAVNGTNKPAHIWDHPPRLPPSPSVTSTLCVMDVIYQLDLDDDTGWA